MALHDTYARRTPFELTFPERERAETLSDEVAREAAARGVDAAHPRMFATLGSVGAFLTELSEPDAPPEAVHQYAMLAFHGVHFVRAGFPVYLLGAGATRRLVAGAAEGGAPEGGARPPADAGYLQLPQHLFWVEGDDGQVPESVDGIFWTATPHGVLHALLATGVRPDRPGLGVVPLPEAPLADADQWLSAEVRGEGEGRDFESSIPGATLDDLYGIRTAGEALKLLAGFFTLSASAPGSVEACDPASGVGPESPTPSAFPFKRVDVDG
jgi:hypothetical protein